MCTAQGRLFIVACHVVLQRTLACYHTPDGVQLVHTAQTSLLNAMEAPPPADHEKFVTDGSAATGLGTPELPAAGPRRPRTGWTNSFRSSFLKSLYLFASPQEGQSPPVNDEEKNLAATAVGHGSTQQPNAGDSARAEEETDKLKSMDVFWEQYGKEADASDKELVGALGGGLDALLVFVSVLTGWHCELILIASARRVSSRPSILRLS